MRKAVAFSRWVTAAALVALAVVGAAASAGDDQFTKDKQECAPQLVVLAPCLPYVGGNAKTPTMDCCSSLKQVLNASKKCLCLLVKYRNEPDLGVKINAELALGLPAVCHAPSNISSCPALLHLAPNSPDAKVFTDFAEGKNSTATSSSSAPATGTPASTSSDSKAGDGGPSMRRLGTLAVFHEIVVVFFFLVSLSNLI